MQMRFSMESIVS
jgi:hypothetical protein